MNTIKIFLASSEELKPERDEMDTLVGNLNLRLSLFDLNIQLVKWEFLDSSMGPKHKQEDYNEELRDCDICLVLFWTRFGDYTAEELDVAYNELCAGRKPNKLYVYFKDGAELSPELRAFRDSFPQKYGHFYNHFQNADTLKADFLLQFIDYNKNYLQGCKLVEVKEGQVSVGGKVYVELKNVPFAGNNEEYNLLMKSIKKTQKLLSITHPDDPEYREYTIELTELKERQTQMENSLWDTALMITQLSTTQCSERLKRAMDLFSQGDNKGALAVLNEEEIDRDINHNLQLIQLGEEGKKGLAINIDEMLLKIKALETERKDGWFEDVDRLYRRCIGIGLGHLTEQKTFEVLFGYAQFLQCQNRFNLAEIIYKEIIEQLKQFKSQDSDFSSQFLIYGIHTLLGLAEVLHEKQCYIESENLNKQLLEILRSLTMALPEAFESLLCRALHNLGVVYLDTNRLNDSELLLKEALEIRRRLAESDSQESMHKLALTLGNLGLVYLKTQQYNESEKLVKEGLEIQKKIVASNPQTYEGDMAIMLDLLAVLYSCTQRFDEAEGVFLEALTIFRRLAETSPQAYDPRTASTLCELACLYSETRRFDEAEGLFLEALDIYRCLVETNPKAYEPDMAATLYELAILYHDAQRFDEAEGMYVEALEFYRRLAETNPKAYEPDMAKIMSDLGELYHKTQRFSEAVEMYKDAAELFQRLAKDDNA